MAFFLGVFHDMTRLLVGVLYDRFRFLLGVRAHDGAVGLRLGEKLLRFLLLGAAFGHHRFAGFFRFLPRRFDFLDRLRFGL